MAKFLRVFKPQEAIAGEEKRSVTKVSVRRPLGFTAPESTLGMAWMPYAPTLPTQSKASTSMPARSMKATDIGLEELSKTMILPSLPSAFN